MDAGKIVGMKFDSISASESLLPDLVKLLNLGFEDYLVPIQFSLPQFLTMVRKDSIDLTTSRILLADDEPSGIALIARRGWTSRLAAMGILQAMRGKGAGSWFMEKLIDEARERSDHEIVLEVIEQNEAAVRLYQKYGFQTIRRLIGFSRTDAMQTNTIDLQEIDLRTAGSLISMYGLRDLPWQLSAETIAHLNPPARAYRKGQSYAVISNPDAEQVVIWSLLVEQDARGNELGVEMLNSIAAKHTGKTWRVPALLPEELGKTYVKAGFEKEHLSQWQMSLTFNPIPSSI